MQIQINKITGESYQGQNQVDLQVAKQNNNYQSNEWLTFLQAKSLGLMIKKGSKGVSIFKGFGKAEWVDKNGKLKIDSVPLGSARVFNLDCTQKYEDKTLS